MKRTPPGKERRLRFRTVRWMRCGKASQAAAAWGSILQPSTNGTVEKRQWK